MGSVPERNGRGNGQLAATYVRVSSKEQVEGYSLDAQRRACQDFCRNRGYTIIASYADEGVSAHTDNLAKRPEFSRLLADAEAGRFSIIVVHKMDRFARKLRVALECLEHLGRVHVGVVSVSEPDLDYSTPQGFLFLSMLGALAEWYSRNLSAETKKGWAERKRRGLYAGRLPFGSVRGDDGIPVPDDRPTDLHGETTSNHAGLVLAFERAAEGATDAEVAEALNAAGYRPSPHARRARFTREAIRTILANRFYVGELPIGKRGAAGWLKGAHEPLVPVEMFEAVQRQRAHRASHKSAVSVPRQASVHALSGLVRCGTCGEPMHLEGKQRLACWGRRQANACRARSVPESTVEFEVGAYLHTLRFPEDAKQRILQSYRDVKPEVAERDRQRQAVEGQLRRLADLFVMGDLTKGEYEAKRVDLRAQLSRFAETDGHGKPEVLDRLQRYVLDAGAAWDEADAGQRHRLAQALFDTVIVQDRHVAAVRPRPEFLPYLVLAKTETPPHSLSNGTALSDESPKGRARGDSNPNLLPIDLFTPCDVPVGQSVRVAGETSVRPAKRGPSDQKLQALSAEGLTLRQIAERVGLSHETVRTRLLGSAAGDQAPSVV